MIYDLKKQEPPLVGRLSEAGSGVKPLYTVLQTAD